MSDVINDVKNLVSEEVFENLKNELISYEDWENVHCEILREIEEESREHEEDYECDEDTKKIINDIDIHTFDSNDKLESDYQKSNWTFHSITYSILFTIFLPIIIPSYIIFEIFKACGKSFYEAYIKDIKKIKIAFNKNNGI